MAQSLGKFEMRSSSSGIHWNSARAGGVPIAPAPPSGAAASVPQLNNPFNINHTSEPDQVATESNLGFPVRLHYMLTDIHKEGSQTNIVSWQPHGRCVCCVCLSWCLCRCQICHHESLTPSLQIYLRC